MRPDVWRRAEELFHAALEQSPEMRRTFLDCACANDFELRRQVDRLVSAEEAAGSFLDEAGVADPVGTIGAAGSLTGQEFGHYRIVAPLGQQRRQAHGRGASQGSRQTIRSHTCLLAWYPQRGARGVTGR
jgi:hypothetical protein